MCITFYYQSFVNILLFLNLLIMFIIFYDKIFLGGYMSIFSRFLKKNVDIKKIVVDNQSYIPKVIHEIEFHSDHIEDIIVDNFIDTSDPLNIAKYKSNLKVLERQILETKKYDKMFIIRNDDFLPPEWIWRVNSAEKENEKVCLNIS